MNKKSLVKFAHENEKGLMHYVIFQGEVVVLSALESKKIDYVNKNGALQVSFDITSDSYDLLKADVVTDPEYVGKVYNYMIETNNAYFKDGYEGLCVLKLHK